MMASQESQAMLTLPLFGVEMERFISSKIPNIGSLIQRANLMLELISIQRFDEFIYRFIQQELNTKHVQDISLWGLPDNIDGALQWDNRRTYFFKSGNYWRYNDRNFSVDKGDPAFPRATAQWWFGCAKVRTWETVLCQGFSCLYLVSGESLQPGTRQDYRLCGESCEQPAESWGVRCWHWLRLWLLWGGGAPPLATPMGREHKHYCHVICGLQTFCYAEHKLRGKPQTALVTVNIGHLFIQLVNDFARYLDRMYNTP